MDSSASAAKANGNDCLIIAVKVAAPRPSSTNLLEPSSSDPLPYRLYNMINSMFRIALRNSANRKLGMSEGEKSPK